MSEKAKDAAVGPSEERIYTVSTSQRVYRLGHVDFLQLIPSLPPPPTNR